MIVVVGDVILDTYIFGDVERVSPEAPVPVVNQSYKQNRLGGAANVANILVSNGMDVSLFSSVYDDATGREIIKLCDISGIKNNIRIIKDRSGITSHKTRIVANNQHICRLDNESKAPTHNQEIIEYFDSIDDFKICILSDYGKGVLAQLPSLVENLKARNIKIVVDPKSNDIQKYNGVYLLKPNLGEFKKFLFTKKIKLQSEKIEDLLEAAKDLLSDTTIENLLITMNRKGSLLVSRDGYHKYYRQDDVQVSDVTGAGDTVLAFLALELSKGQCLDAAIYCAMQASLIAVQKFGTEPVLLSELPKKGLIVGNLAKDKITAIKQMKLNGEKIVFANGCFDILHLGHINLLKEAKKLGDRLIVAINSDESVRRLKGPERPINALDHRIKMLEALSSVDIVISFNDDTPLNLIKNIKPDFLVKGSDYTKTDVVGHEDMSLWGGEVVIINLTEGFSTTNFIEKLKL